jgi:hypothetical protein
MNEPTVEELAWRMRGAIEALVPQDLPKELAGFPKHTCGDASLLLGAYLKDQGHEDFRLISAERFSSPTHKAIRSHAWLARAGLIVDITADQFAEGLPKVIVTEQSPWHEAFETERPASSDFRDYKGAGGYPLYHLASAYAKLRPKLFPR